LGGGGECCSSFLDCLKFFFIANLGLAPKDAYAFALFILDFLIFLFSLTFKFTTDSIPA
jgi:hypothetical protein